MPLLAGGPGFGTGPHGFGTGPHGYGTGDGWLNDPDIKLFDSNHFASELTALESLEESNTDITMDLYNAFITFLTHLTDFRADFGSKSSLSSDNFMLKSALGHLSSHSFIAPSQMPVDEEQVSQCAQLLVQEGYCSNILVFVTLLVKDGIDFSGDEGGLEDALHAVAQEAEGVKGDEPILSL